MLFYVSKADNNLGTIGQMLDIGIDHMVHPILHPSAGQLAMPFGIEGEYQQVDLWGPITLLLL